MARDLDVLAFGEALVDFFPPRPGVPLVDCDVFHRHLGGAPCNVTVGLARQGARVGLMTLVGPDDFGRFVRGHLAAEGVDVRGVGTHPSAKTGITFVAVSAAGDRSFLFFRHPSADQQIGEADVDAAAIARARIFHVGSSTLSREPARAATWKALAAARAAGCVVSTDPNWRPHLWERPAEARPLLERLLAHSDIVKVSDDELEPMVGLTDVEAGARRIRALGPSLVLVTLGARGCYFDAAAGVGWSPGEAVPVVDTTGAGDAFVAGVLATLAPIVAARPIATLAIDEVARACALGNHLGARAVTALGATTALSRRAP
jgi:sugar/nucleoside kinase (ribokinase family)